MNKKEALETIENMIKIRERDARNLRKNYPDATNEWINCESAYNQGEIIALQMAYNLIREI